ncbi:MAG: hypothetical protein ACKO02_03110 [Cyanobium sp.]
MSDRILLAHGGGGSLTQQLIRQELLPLYGRPEGGAAGAARRRPAGAAGRRRHPGFHL